MYLISTTPLQQCSGFLQPFAGGCQMKPGVAHLAESEGQANALAGPLDGIEGVAR
jgi:hypothetical protein